MLPDEPGALLSLLFTTFPDSATKIDLTAKKSGIAREYF